MGSPAVTTPSTGDVVRVNDDTLYRKGIKTVTAGVIDDRARSVFTEGWCWALALAIEESAGHPIHVVVDDRGFWIHAGNLIETSGEIVDIEGCRPADAWVSRWAATDPGVIGSRELTDRERYTFGWMCGSNEEQALDVARSFVAPVLRFVRPVS